MKKVTLKLWDLSGAATFNSCTKSYFRDSAAAIVVYDLHEKDSLPSIAQGISRTREETRLSTNLNIPMILVGNKVHD